jgi:glycosyltransferase involved in cell wall biosynthesis
VVEYWLVDDAPIFGGAERNMLRLARFINESVPDRSARVVCPEHSQLAEHCRRVGILVVHATFPDLGVASAPDITLAVKRLRWTLREAGKTAVVVCPTLRTQVYAHAALFGRRSAPQVVHLLPEQDSARRLTTRLMLRRYGAVVALGANAARAYQALVPGYRVRTANNFLLPDEFLGRLPALPPPRTDPPLALGVLARLIPEKGVLELIEELAVVPQLWSRLVVGGERQDERYVRTVEERVRDLGLEHRVRLLGHIEALADFFAAIDALVVPSVGNEGQPTVILEALVHGRPALVRASTWSAEFDGLPVHPYRDSDDLAQSLADLEDTPVNAATLAERFGPAQLIEAIELAAEHPKHEPTEVATVT